MFVYKYNNGFQTKQWFWNDDFRFVNKKKELKKLQECFYDDLYPVKKYN